MEDLRRVTDPPEPVIVDPDVERCELPVNEDIVKVLKKFGLLALDARAMSAENSGDRIQCEPLACSARAPELEDADAPVGRGAMKDLRDHGNETS
jgi:hypothetical protein